MRQAAGKLALSLCCLSAMRAWARTGAANGLVIAESPRAEAMGGAAAAVGRDPALVWSSPAAPAGSPQRVVAAAIREGSLGDRATRLLVAAPAGPGVFTAGALLWDAGVASAFTSEGLEWAAALQRDYVVMVGFALAPVPWLAAGVTVKGMASLLAEQTGASGWSLDAGVQARLSQRLKLGASVSNLGRALVYEAAATPLPRTARAGFAAGWRARHGRDAVLVALDVVSRASSSRLDWNAGIEYSVGRRLALRAGLRPDPWTRRAVVPVGLAASAGMFSVEYAAGLRQTLGPSHVVALTVTWGTTPPAVGPTATPDH